MPPCLVGLEACGGAHYWARELQKLGHDVRLMAVALAAKHARILWALLAHGQDGKTISWRHKRRFLTYRMARTLTTVNNSPLAARRNDVMANGRDRHAGNPLTPQVQRETAARMVPACTPDHQGQSKLAHQ